MPGCYYFGERRVKVIKSVVIPVNLEGRKVGLTTEVVEGDIT